MIRRQEIGDFSISPEIMCPGSYACQPLLFFCLFSLQLPQQVQHGIYLIVVLVYISLVADDIGHQVLISHLHIFFGELYVQILCTLFNQVSFFISCNTLYILDTCGCKIQLLISYMDWKFFLPYIVLCLPLLVLFVFSCRFAEEFPLVLLVRQLWFFFIWECFFVCLFVCLCI